MFKMNLFNRKKKLDILVLGTDGMLGYDVYKTLTKMSYQKNSIINNVIGFDREKLDFYNILKYDGTLEHFFYVYKHFDYIINCVAMTDTYAAENTKEGEELSYKLNALFPKRLALICKIRKTKLIHISTDYVFSEKSPEYSIDGPHIGFTQYDTPFPINNYGMHKLVGEQFIKENLKEKDYAILRTSWLYGQHNQKSFVHKFIKHAFECMNNNKDIEVTENEYSVPTSTNTVIEYIKLVLNKKLTGIIHAVCGSNCKPVSRYDFAKCVAEQYNFLVDEYPSLNRKKIDIEKIVKITRDDKLQPTYSYMYNFQFDTACNNVYNWENEIYRFLRKNFKKLYGEEK
jgi:dTDP-4-dehydrorhamnose reductase